VGDKKTGRRAQTRGVSLSPREAELVDAFANLTGLGLTEQVRQNVIRRLPAAVALLQDMEKAGMDIGAPTIRERIVYAEGDTERRGLYEHSFGAEDVRQPAGAAG
jgi:hypothetical protein